jgi:hypothetical protein
MGRSTSVKAAAVKTPARRKEGAQGIGKVTVLGPLTATSLQNVLWDTLQDLRTNDMLPNRADAIAAQAREILRTVKTQLMISSAARRGLPKSVLDFSEA